MPHGTGTVHDKGDPGEMNKSCVGYINVTTIRGKRPKKIQLIPFIQDPDSPLDERTVVDFDIDVYNLTPATEEDSQVIRIAAVIQENQSS